MATVELPVEQTAFPASDHWRDQVGKLVLELDHSGIAEIDEERYDDTVVLRGDLEDFDKKAQALERDYQDCLYLFSRAVSDAEDLHSETAPTFRENGTSWFSNPNDEDEAGRLANLSDLHANPSAWTPEKMTATVDHLRASGEIRGTIADLTAAATAVLALAEEFGELAARTAALCEI
jgi:hypothetical protein